MEKPTTGTASPKLEARLARGGVAAGERGRGAVSAMARRPSPTRFSITSTIRTTPLSSYFAPDPEFTFRTWIADPGNAVWAVCLPFLVFFTVFLLFVQLGFLNRTFPDPRRRNDWIEIASQVLNFIFTLFAVLFHPRRMKAMWHALKERRLIHEYMQQTANDPATAQTKLNMANMLAINTSTLQLQQQYKWHHPPHSSAYLLLLILILNMNCLSQYILCGAMWLYTPETRPLGIIIMFLPLGPITEVAAKLMTVWARRHWGSSTLDDFDHHLQLGPDANGPHH